MLTRILDIVARLVAGGAFIYAAVVKLQGPLQFASTVESYRLVPVALVPWIVTGLPWLELVVGVLLLVGWQKRLFATATASMLVVFIAAMAITYARGIEADCGCFGPGERISPLTILRDSLLLLPAIYLIVRPKPIATKSTD
jgi:uncharacterized membrane protein YphA (DoxX/SURF4 family)